MTKYLGGKKETCLKFLIWMGYVLFLPKNNEDSMPHFYGQFHKIGHPQACKLPHA